MSEIDMKICITGGSGFIGTRLCRRLISRGCLDFVIVDKEQSVAFADHVSIANVCSVDSLRVAIPDCSVLVHLAAEHRDDVRPVSLYRDVNVQGAKNICEIAREKGVNTIVFTSTVAVYGFAPLGTDESGEIRPFNDYGRSKYDAERIFREWQSEAASVRTLVIVRPTVVFGEENRGNVYNLLRYVASGRFVMVGRGLNRKSLAYVENVAAFIEFSMSFAPGIHVFNFVDKPDFDMNELVRIVGSMLGRSSRLRFRLPFAFAYGIGKVFDFASLVTGRRYAISAIRIAKFCSDSVYNTAIKRTGFVAPVPLERALEQTVRHEFVAPAADIPGNGVSI